MKQLIILFPFLLSIGSYSISIRAMHAGNMKPLLGRSILGCYRPATPALIAQYDRPYSTGGGFLVGLLLGRASRSGTVTELEEHVEELESRMYLEKLKFYKEFFDLIVLRETSPSEYERLILRKGLMYAAILKDDLSDKLKRNRMKQSSWFILPKTRQGLKAEEIAICAQLKKHEGLMLRLKSSKSCISTEAIKFLSDNSDLLKKLP